MKETAKHRRAFEYYYDLGESRGLVAVALEFGVSKQSAEKWSRNFGWGERVLYRDKEIADAIEVKRIAEYKKDKTKMYGLTQTALAQFQKELVAKKVRVNTVSDFEKLVRIAAALNGENMDVTTSVDITVNVPDMEEEDDD